MPGVDSSERIKKYEDYLLDYPFDTRMPKTDTLEAWEPDETIESHNMTCRES